VAKKSSEGTRRPAVIAPSFVRDTSERAEAAPRPRNPPPRRYSSPSLRWSESRGFADDSGHEEPAFSPSASGGKFCSLYRKFKGRVPDEPLRQILYYLSKDPGRRYPGRGISDASVVSFADYSRPSEEERYYQLDFNSGEITREKVSHGAGSCFWRNGQRICSGGSNSMLKRCGTGSNYTRSGFFRIESTYYSRRGYNRGWPLLERSRRGPVSNGLKMRGLTLGVNWSAEDDGIIMHEARYNVERVGTPMGRSSGCVAFAPGCLKRLVGDISGGSLFYSYAPQCRDQMRMVERQIQGWQSFCQ
jgi:hypothetical protein